MISQPRCVSIVVAAEFSDGSMARIDTDGGNVILNWDEYHGHQILVEDFAEYRQTTWKPEQVSIEDGSVVDESVQDPAPPASGAAG